MSDTLGSTPLDWHKAALIAGEQLASVGPNGYYHFTPDEWLAWVRQEVAMLRPVRFPTPEMYRFWKVD